LCVLLNLLVHIQYDLRERSDSIEILVFLVVFIIILLGESNNKLDEEIDNSYFIKEMKRIHDEKRERDKRYWKD